MFKYLTKEKKYIFFVLLVSSILILSACSSSLVKSPGGSNVINLRFNIGRDFSEVSVEDIEEINVEIYKDNVQIISENITMNFEQTISIPYQKSGNYKIKVKVKGQDDTLLYTGTAVLSNINGIVTVTSKDFEFTIVANNQLTQIKGQIVDESGNEIKDLEVHLGSQKIITNRQGEFKFSYLNPGEYTLSFKDISTNREIPFIINDLTFNIEKYQIKDLGKIKAYQITGIGVILQSMTTTLQNQTTGNQYSAINQQVEEMDWANLAREDSLYSITEKSLEKNMEKADLINKIALILIKWKPIQQVISYKIKYNNQEIWNSKNLNENVDPAFNSDEPEAYLDLNDELAGKITETGSYQFQIIGVKNSGEIKLPVINTSLGQMTDNYPDNINYDENSGILNWQLNNEPNNVSYRVSIAEDYANIAIGNFKYQTDKISANEVSINGQLEKGDYIVIDAFAYDNGWLVEMSRGYIVF